MSSSVLIDVRPVHSSGAEANAAMSGTSVIIRSGVLTAPPSDAEARVEMVWHLPGGSSAERLEISAREGEPLYAHLVSHAFAPAMVGPETTFILDGPSLCGANSTPIIFRDPGSGYFADVYAEDATLELVITTDPAPPAGRGATRDV